MSGSVEPTPPERLRLWLERDRRGAGYHLRDAATGERVTWEDPRLRVVAVAGVSFRPEVAIWNDERTLQAGYVPREVAAELEGVELAVALWRAGEGLRVLLVPVGSWIGRPRR